jgi:NitT/TauT family transport system substrate-binding protein
MAADFFNEITAKEGLFALMPERIRKSWGWVSKAKGYPANKIDPLSVVDTRFLPQ